MPQFHVITPRVLVADLTRTMQFYATHLGFQVDVAWPQDKPTFCILQRDRVSIGFFEPDAHHTSKGNGGCEFYIEVEDAAGLHAALAGKVSIAWGPEVYSYGRREFAIIDPDGYMLIFTEPTDDPPTCSEE